MNIRMKIMLPLLALAAVLTAQQACPARAESAASAPAAAGSKPASSPAREESIPKALLDAARASFVVVEIWYKKDTSDTSDSQRDVQHRTFMDYIEKKCPEERTGIVIAPGEIMVADDGTEDRFIEKIVVRDVSGRSYPARRGKLLCDAPGIILTVDAPAAALKPLQFSPLKNRDLTTKLQQAVLTKSDEQWQLVVQPLAPAAAFKPAKPENLYYGVRGTVLTTRTDSEIDLENAPAIAADGEGKVIGCSAAAFMDLLQAEYKWQGADLLKCASLPWKDFCTTQEKVRSQWISAMQEVVLTLRQGAGADEATPPSSRRGMRGGETEGSEVSVYGVAISKNLILVSLPLTRDVAASIDKIYVKFSPTNRQAAEFAGAYKETGAFLVRLPKGNLPFIKPSTLPAKSIRPFLVVSPRKKFGNKYVDLVCNRLYGKTRGHGGLYHWYPARPIDEGDFLSDFEGNLAGIYLKERLENEEEQQIERQDRLGTRGSQFRIFTAEELHDCLTKPKEHLDREITVKTRTESKRRAWFGVEYVPMTPELAENFKVEAPTKDGQVGLVVSAVYPDSPAAKLGIRVSDILLRIEAPGLDNPLDLASRQAGEEGSGMRRHGFAIGDSEGPEEEMAPVEPTWKSPRNFLNFALDKIKVGRKITLTYYRHDGEGKGEIKKLDYVIEQSPPDFDSAMKWKNRKIGLTVKDLTYEIRYALGLAKDAPGVIVANLEPGSPARVAKIFPNEIITRLNDVPLSSAKQMRELVAKSQKAGQQKVRLTILRLGKTRFADLAVSAYDAAEDEGPDEE